MTSKFSISGLASALLLLSLLGGGACVEYVTMAACAHAPHVSQQVRIRQYPADSNATCLSLARCNLTRINLEDLAGLPKLEFLLLGSNKLRELPVFEDGSCPNLNALFLSKNQLTAIGNERAFSACVKLKILDLGYNLIMRIHPDAFKSLTELESLDLSHNFITLIPSQMFVSNKKLYSLDLNDNIITHLPPKFVSRLKEFWFHDNPWHCGCLLELLLDVHKAGVRNHAFWNYSGKKPLCVYTGAVTCIRPAPRAAGADRSKLRD